jgi:hypothetical protein
VRLAISEGETATLSGQMSMALHKRREWLLQAQSHLLCTTIWTSASLPGFDRTGRSTSKAFRYRPSTLILVSFGGVRRPAAPPREERRASRKNVNQYQMSAIGTAIS